MDTYAQIARLINNEVDEILNDRMIEDEITFENEAQKESFRDDLIADYLNFLKKDLTSSHE